MQKISKANLKKAAKAKRTQYRVFLRGNVVSILNGKGGNPMRPVTVGEELVFPGSTVLSKEAGGINTGRITECINKGKPLPGTDLLVRHATLQEALDIPGAVRAEDMDTTEMPTVRSTRNTKTKAKKKRIKKPPIIPADDAQALVAHRALLNKLKTILEMSEKFSASPEQTMDLVVEAIDESRL